MAEGTAPAPAVAFEGAADSGFYHLEDGSLSEVVEGVHPVKPVKTMHRCRVCGAVAPCHCEVCRLPLSDHLRCNRMNFIALVGGCQVLSAGVNYYRSA